MRSLLILSVVASKDRSLFSGIASESLSSSFKIPSNVPPSGISNLSENIVAVYPDDFILRTTSGLVVVSRGISNSSG